MSWYQQGMQVAIELMFDCFWTQTYVTAFDIVFNISLEGWPIVFPADKVLDFINAKMSCQRVVVVPTDDLCLNDFRYKQ